MRAQLTRWLSVGSPGVDRPLLAVVLGLLLSGTIVLLLTYWPARTGALGLIAPLLFLLPVVLAATLGGWRSGACVTVVAVAVWDWFFLLPAQSLAIDSTDDAVTLLVYLTVAALLGQLSMAMRRRAAAALHHEAELAAVLDVAKAVASTLDLAPLLEVVLEQVQRVIACTSAAVLLQDGDQLRIVGYRGPTPREHVVGQTWPLAEVIVYRELQRRRAPIILADLWEASPEAALFRRAHKIRVLGQQKERSWLWVPLLSNEQFIGLISLGHVMPHAFTARQADLALAMAQQVAVAIENARLYARSQETAALEERHRLARDLHDSVTQMLFSASLVAEVLPRLWDRDPKAVGPSLDDLRLLTRGASAEMRSLLLELRPAALTETPMEELLRQLSEAMTARTRIPIAVTVEGVQPLPPLPAPVQVALYRVAQEALSNAAHHAQARHITVTLRTTPEDTALRIHDDGRGFDPAALRPGHFGLDMMRERADEVGAALRISSVPGTGTEVVAKWPDPAR